MATPKLNILQNGGARHLCPPQTASGGLAAGLTTGLLPRRADSFWFQRARIFEESDGQRGKPSSNAVAIQKLKKFVAHTRVVTEYLFYDALKSGKISLGECCTTVCFKG